MRVVRRGFLSPAPDLVVAADAAYNIGLNLLCDHVIMCCVPLPPFDKLLSNSKYCNQ